jgi:hypothetical protein
VLPGLEDFSNIIRSCGYHNLLSNYTGIITGVPNELRKSGGKREKYL